MEKRGALYRTEESNRSNQGKQPDSVDEPARKTQIGVSRTFSRHQGGLGAFFNLAAI
jgi:hypothetical protein